MPCARKACSRTTRPSPRLPDGPGRVRRVGRGPQGAPRAARPQEPGRQAGRGTHESGHHGRCGGPGHDGAARLRPRWHAHPPPGGPTCPRGYVDPADVAAVRAWREAGHLFVPASGRSVGNVRHGLAGTGLVGDHVLCHTGAAVVADGALVPVPGLNRAPRTPGSSKACASPPRRPGRRDRARHHHGRGPHPFPTAAPAARGTQHPGHARGPGRTGGHRHAGAHPGLRPVRADRGGGREAMAWSGQHVPLGGLRRRRQRRRGQGHRPALTAGRAAGGPRGRAGHRGGGLRGTTSPCSWPPTWAWPCGRPRPRSARPRTSLANASATSSRGSSPAASRSLQRSVG